MPARLELLAPDRFPEIRPGDDLAACVLEALGADGLALRDGDVLVLAQKIVSKAEGRLVALADVAPGARARALAAETGKDPRLVELVLGESTEVLRTRPNVIVVAHRLGLVHANAGIDQSNLDAGDGSRPGDAHALLLPMDPDRSATDLHEALRRATGVTAGVLIADSAGRAWRLGTVGIVIGAAGCPVYVDARGLPDRSGRPMQVTTIGRGDEIAAAAGLLMGQGDEGRPLVLVRGLPAVPAGARTAGTAAALVRPRDEDLFR